MAKWIRVPTALAEDPGSVLIPHMATHNLGTPVPRTLTPFSGLLWHRCGAHTHMRAKHPYTFFIKKSNKINIQHKSHPWPKLCTGNPHGLNSITHGSKSLWVCTRMLWTEADKRV